jgi:hypothetical protein
MKTKVGDIQVDDNMMEWVVVGVGHMGISRVRRNSLAHFSHAKVSPEIAKSIDISRNKQDRLIIRLD